MAGARQSSRQKLINMMYLVLTALLALNVSKEILDSFVTIDESQQRSRITLEEELEYAMDTFLHRAEEKPIKFAAHYERAKEVQEEGEKLITFINRIKAICISETEDIPLEQAYNAQMDTVLQLNHVTKKENYDIVTNILYGTKETPEVNQRTGDSENFRASELRRRISEFKSLVNKNTQNVELTASMDMVFDFGQRADANGVMQEWEHHNFYHTPLAASQSILSKIQTDIRSAELESINSIFNDVEGETMKFTKLREAVIPVTTEVSQGGIFQAEVFLAAYDDTNPPEILLAREGSSIDEERLEIIGEYDILDVDSNMMGRVELPAHALGSKSRQGIIKFKPAGLPEVRRKFSLDYRVTAPTAIVSPTNMNVLYIGVDNPISVGVPGFRPENITASIDNGTLSRTGAGMYTARVSNGRTSKVSLRLELPDGGTKSLPPVEFRILSIPDPVPIIATKGPSDKTVRKSMLQAALGMKAEMKGFLFPVSYKITSFDMTAKYRGTFATNPSRGNKLSDDQKAVIRALPANTKITFENIKAIGPDGTSRALPSINLKIVN